MKECKKVILIIGASSGIGKACALHLSKLGHTVFGTSRKVKEIEEIPIDGEKIMFLQMDVTDPKSIHQGIAKVLDIKGKIDVLIHNAGIGIAGPIEQTSEEEAKWQFDVNFFGAFRVTKAILPYMREWKDGLIIFISSLAGEFGLPYQAFYSASKSALNNFAEALQMECPFIKVVVIEPGDYNTSFTDNRVIVKGFNPDIPPYENFKIVIKIQEELERQGGDPMEIAKLVSKIVQNPSYFYYRIGKNANLISILGKLMPRRFVIREVARHYGL
jgi:NAD(P)-dependent dehydrogenase (short-subunit alcohol dehydrogenase family)